MAVDVIAGSGSIVCVGFGDWDAEVWTNQQHLMLRLSAGRDVLFIESLGLRRPTASGRDLKRLVRRFLKGLRGPRGVEGRVYVLSPLVIPLHSRPSVQRLNALILRRAVSRAVRRLGIAHPVLWGYVPQAEVLLDVLQPCAIVYHCVDDIAAQKGIDGAAFRATETRFAQRADLVLASAPVLLERMRTLSDNVIFAPNVADTRLFSSALETGEIDPEMAVLSEPRAVFVGAVVATKIEFQILIDTARRRPDWSFVLVGPVGLGDPSTDISAVAAEPNLHVLGARPYERLPAVLRGARVGLIPYVRNELTTSIFPMKVYEYMAAGLAVLSTDLPALRAVEGVEVVNSSEELARALDQVDSSETERRRRSALAQAHSWDERVAEIERALAALRPRPTD